MRSTVVVVVVVVVAVEFVLDGLDLSKRLTKEAAGGRATYRSRNRDRALVWVVDG